MRGYDRPKNKNPRQPVATYDRFLAVRAKADEADPQKLFGYFLSLVDGLGWRVSAICQLHASDIDRRTDEDAPNGRIRKRAENDKEGIDAWIPLSLDPRAAVDGILERNPTIGELPLFPAPKTRKGDRPGPWTRFHARNLLKRAEKATEVDELEGGDFHRTAGSGARNGSICRRRTSLCLVDGGTFGVLSDRTRRPMLKLCSA